MSGWLPQSALMGLWWVQVTALGASRAAWLQPALGCCCMALAREDKARSCSRLCCGVAMALTPALGWV